MRLQSWSFIGRLNPLLNRLTNNNKDIGNALLCLPGHVSSSNNLFIKWFYLPNIPVLRLLFPVGNYTSVYASMQFVGIFLAPLSGLLMDRKKGNKAEPSVKRIGEFFRL